MFKSVFFILLGCLCGPLMAQPKSAKNFQTIDYQLVVDNDAFTLDLTKDQYYSSGIYAAVRFLGDSGVNVKKIWSVQLNHRMYTPSWIGWDRISSLDRPYAGQVSVSGIAEFYFDKNVYYKINAELGIMGPNALVGEAQAEWHAWFGMPQPKGWKYQIENTLIANAEITRIKPFYSSYNIELSNITNANIGTVLNNIRHEFMIRLGELRPLHQSAYTSAALGRTRSAKRNSAMKEFYFFYAPGLEYVFQNASLQGSLFSDASPYTVDAIPWIWQHRLGVMFSWSRFDLGLISYWRSQENETATKHNYVGIRLNQRF
ncbi:MAG: lipid A 3-O-deacylase [Marinoscillum sp.]|jgi:lipid A 3-O-deacylase